MTGELVTEDCNTVDSSTALEVALELLRRRSIVNLRKPIDNVSFYAGFDTVQLKEDILTFPT
jgi:hypothetical protein